jgi:hypothetical protein
MKEEIVLDTGLTRGQNSGLDREVWFKFDWFKVSALFRLVIHTDPSYPHQSYSRLQMMTPSGWTTIRAQQVPDGLNKIGWTTAMTTEDVMAFQHDLLLGPAIAEAAIVCAVLCRQSIQRTHVLCSN